MPSVRAFQLTLNEIDRWEKLKSYLMSRKMMDFAIACLEKAPTTGHEHIHCYVHFNQPTRLATSKVEGAHIEACRGSPKQNIEYVKKGGKIIWEYGKEPHQGLPASIKQLREMSKEERDEMPVMMYNIVNKINEAQEADMKIDDLEKQVCVFWIYGESGVGKTQEAKKIVRLNKDLFGDTVNMVKYQSGFWSGVGKAEIAIYDDFRDSDMKPSEFINFIDYNKHYMNVKGGQKLNNYKLIIITSVQNPEEIYRGMSDKEPRKQWLRRMEIIYLTKNNDSDSYDDV